MIDKGLEWIEKQLSEKIDVKVELKKIELDKLSQSFSIIKIQSDSKG